MTTSDERREVAERMEACRLRAAGRKTEGMTMKISDELRKEAAAVKDYRVTFASKRILKLADRIDAEMVELPKDADGEYIHIGDVMEWCDSGETLTVEGIGSDVLFYIDGENAEWTAARNKRHHHHAPTVEDVLREACNAYHSLLIEGMSDVAHDMPAPSEIIAEYSAKLRLANDVEEQ